jgi:hypothetical protein
MTDGTMAIDPLSVAVGVGIAAVVSLAIVGVGLVGYRQARRPDYIVDMREVSNFYRHSNAARRIRVEDRDG